MGFFFHALEFIRTTFIGLNIVGQCTCDVKLQQQKCIKILQLSIPKYT
jgi:hypothetical protein